MDEKGTISKDKLIKGAILLSGISMIAKSQAAIDYEQYRIDHQNSQGYGDDRNGWDGAGGISLVPIMGVETNTKIAGHHELENDGGPKFLPPNHILPGFPMCTVPCFVVESPPFNKEVKITTCINIPMKPCLPCCFPKDGKNFPQHVSIATTIHANVDRAWHTNDLELSHDEVTRALEAKHYHHGKHNNGDTTNCLGTTQGANPNMCVPKMRGFCGGS